MRGRRRRTQRLLERRRWLTDDDQRAWRRLAAVLELLPAALDSQLVREGLDVPGRVLSRWLAAAALVRPAQDGGVAVVTAEHPETVGALIRWDPDGFASHQLQERRELHLPPAGRLAEVTGEAAAVAEYLELVLRRFAEAVGRDDLGGLPPLREVAGFSEG